MNMLYRSHRVGFTLVELAIVLAVIGVIATITYANYNGTQDRARSVKIVNQAKAYVEGLQLWEAQEGRPATNSCIAPSSALTGGLCPSASSWTSSAPWDATFNQKLADYSGIKTMELGAYGSDNPKGLMWYNANYYSDNRGVLFYTVGPNNNCELSDILSPNPGYDNMTLMNADYTARDAVRTQCMVEVFKY